MNEDELKEIIAGVYSEGFQDGQLAMIQTFEDAGLINQTLASIMAHIPTGWKINVNEHYDKTQEIRITEEAVKEILKG